MTRWQRLHTERLALCPVCLTPTLESRLACECPDGPTLNPNSTFALLQVEISKGGVYRLRMENVTGPWRRPVETTPWSIVVQGQLP